MSAAPALGAIDPGHLALVARTLQIAPEIWLATIAAFEARLPSAPRGETADDEIADVAEIDRRLAALAAAYRPLSPHEAAPPAAAAPRTCAACGRAGVAPSLARRSAPQEHVSKAASHPRSARERLTPDLVYGRCDRCGHGALLGDPAGAAARARYAGDDYFRVRDPGGAGYDGYAGEEAYRVAKGARLIERLRRASARPVRTLLEVGSGFGYTRVAAERAGLRTSGVDISAHAVREAARRYGLETFHGTLGEALASSGADFQRTSFDVVLYQFVLEHVADPIAELALAREALAPGGSLVLLVPSMEAAEIAAFGASYRSFRADHLHLFSRASLAAVLARAGFAVRELDSHCNIHLLRGVLSAPALDRLYASGRGPDLFVLAGRSP